MSLRLHMALAQVAAALTEIEHYEPTGLADTHDLLTILAGDGPYSVAAHLGRIVARLGAPSTNPTLHHLPGGAAELVQTATDYYVNVVLDGGVDVADEALQAIKLPWDARPAADFLATHGVQVDEPTAPVAPAPADVELEARLGGAR